MADDNWCTCKKCRSGYLVGYSWDDRTHCRDCSTMLTNLGEADHRHAVRCPACGHIDEVTELGLYEQADPFDDSTGSVCCMSCDHEYEVKIQVQVTFVSPARKEEDHDDEG